MPFEVVKQKRGFKVRDDEGNFYSKKPLTKKMARKQQQALYASENNGQMIKGKGFCCFTDGDNCHIILQGDGFFSDAWAKVKSVANTITNKVISTFATPVLQTTSTVSSLGIRENYPPQVRQTLAQFGEGQIYDIKIIREPIQSFINKALNIITLGRFQDAKENLKYDDLYHLSMIVSMSMPDGDRKLLKIEKNQVINITDKFSLKSEGISSGISQHGSGQDARFINVPVACCITLQEMLDKTVAQVGPSFYKYDAFTNNCQMFISNILKANNLLTPEIQAFVVQDVQSLLQQLPKYTRPFANTITNLAGLADKFLYGEGVLSSMADIQQPTSDEAIAQYLQPDGSWTGPFELYQQLGFPGCGPNSYYSSGESNLYEQNEQYACNADKQLRDTNEADNERFSNTAQVRTATQDDDSMKRYLAIQVRKDDEQNSKIVSSESGIPPVPKWEDISPLSDTMTSTPTNPSTYTGFAKVGENQPNQFDIYYIKNGLVVRSGLQPGMNIKNSFDWKKIEERWNRLQQSDSTRPGQFATNRKDGSMITFDKDGKEKFDVRRHGTAEWLNSVEGRHIREADPYFEELFQRLKENKPVSEEALEKQYQDEVERRYGSNVDILSPEAGFTLTDKNGVKQRVNKVRLRKDGGYDIQYANGLYEYQAGEDEWECNEWKKGDRIENYNVCGTDERKKAAERVKKNIDRERDSQWEQTSGFDKFVNGLSVAGAFTQDYVLPIASTIASFIPGVGTAISTGLDVAGAIAGQFIGDDCRHFNECTAQQKAKAEVQALYHRTKGDSVAERYLQDENFQKLLEGNEKVYDIIRDTAQYGSRAGKFAETGKGLSHSMKRELVKKHYGGVKKDKDSTIPPLFKRQLKENKISPEEYLKVAKYLAEINGYDPRALEFSDTGNNKLMIYDDDGAKRHFGAVSYNDFIIYTRQEMLGIVPLGTAEAKRKQYLARATKIKGDWKKDMFSPNNLAIKITWGG